MVYHGFKCVEPSNTFKFKTNALMDLLVAALRVNFKQLRIRWGGFGEKNKTSWRHLEASYVMLPTSCRFGLGHVYLSFMQTLPG